MVRLPLVGVALAAAWCQPVAAQLLPPDDSLIQFHRYTAVRERVIPGYSPTSIELGGATLLPRLEVSGEYTDNIYAVATPRVGDEYVDVAPSALLTTGGDRQSLSLDASSNITRYAAHPSENAEEVDASAYGIQHIGAGTRLRLIGRYHQDRESRESENVTVLTKRRVRYETADVALGASQRFANVLLSAEGGFERASYFNAQLFDGTPLDQQFRDSDVTTTRLRAEVAQSPSLAYFAQATRASIDYRIAGAGRGSRNLEVLGGVRFELPILARGEIGVGYARADFDSAVRSFSGLGINSSVTFFPTELLTVTLDARRSVNDAGTPNSTGYIALSGGAQVDYELLRSLILGAGVAVERDTFNGFDRRDDRVSGSASVEWRAKGGWAIRASYDVLDLTSSGTARYKSFNRNRVLIGLRFFT